MKPLRVLLICTLAGAATAAAPERGFSTTRLAGSVSLLQGFDCNIVASAGEDGVVMVDTCVSKTAEKLLASVQGLSDKPLRLVIDTHVHGDHTGANAFFQRLAPVIASNNVRKWLISGNDVTRDKPAPPDALPTITFEGEMTLHLNGEEIRLLSLPPAHTDGDVVVLFKNANVVATGDVYMSPAVSFGDRWYGGGMLPLIDALELLLPQIPADAQIVPGHGVISTRDDVARGLDIMKKMKALVEGGVREGKTLEQLVAARPFDQFRTSLPAWDTSDKSLDGRVKQFHRELTAKK
jgi:glyoxylase-like metal-dependent hydrolase (beta-lactamase superfamily II)